MKRRFYRLPRPKIKIDITNEALLRIAAERIHFTKENPQMISMDKKYKTRYGMDVRLLCTDGPGVQCVVGILDGSVHRWNQDGAFMPYGRYDQHDLVEDKPERGGYVNVYKNGAIGDLHITRESADRAAFRANERIACVKVTYTEGQFDA